MSITNKRLYIEYTGSWPRHCWHYDGAAHPFWTLDDGRQVTSVGNETAYRYILARMDNVVPFVPKGDEDWAQIEELADAECKALQVAEQETRVKWLKGRLGNIAAIVGARMQQADEMELDAQRLRSSVLDLEKEEQKYERDLEAAQKLLDEMKGVVKQEPTKEEPEVKSEPDLTPALAGKPKPKAKSKGTNQ